MALKTIFKLRFYTSRKHDADENAQKRFEINDAIYIFISKRAKLRIYIVRGHRLISLLVMRVTRVLKRSGCSVTARLLIYYFSSPRAYDGYKFQSLKFIVVLWAARTLPFL